MAASLNVCPYTVLPRKRLFNTATYDLAVQKLLAKCWVQLNWLNSETEGGFAHLRQVKDSETFKKASTLTKDRVEKGWMSEIEGTIADIPRKIRGDRCYRLFYEEAGSNKVLQTSWIQGKPLVTRGGRKMGTRFAWGTGGDEGPQLQDLSTMFYNPDAYDVLPFKHSYNMHNEPVLTGFFFPAYRMHFDFLDERGVTDEIKAMEFFQNDRDKLKVDPKAHLENCSEFCFTPEEALIRQGSNQFDQELLAEQLTNITVHKTVKAPIRGFLKYTNPDKKDVLKWEPNGRGDILVVEEPLLDENGAPLRNLYVAGIDAIDQGKADSTGQKDVSDFCIVIKRRVHGTKDPQYVAMYKARPDDIRFAYGNAMRLMEWYGCQGLLEATRTNFKEYLRANNKLHLLMFRPKSTLTSSGGQNTKMYGAPANEKTIHHYLELITNFIKDYSFTITMTEFIDNFMKYSYENKRKFDIVAAVGMAELADEELYAKPIVARDQFKKKWSDIGYYTDSYGVKRFGAIPKSNFNNFKP